MEDKKKYIGCDIHRDYSVLRVMDERGTMGPSMKAKHADGELERVLRSFPGQSGGGGNQRQRDVGAGQGVDVNCPGRAEKFPTV